jgi:hypothetical protein
MSNGLCRADPTSCCGMPCRRSSDHYGPSCLAGRASTGFVPVLRPTARPVGQFSCRAGPSSTPCRADPRPIKLTTTHFHQYFLPNTEIFRHYHQLFIIFTNIIINNTYIQVITTPTVHVHRAACLGGGLSTAWSLRPGQPGLSDVPTCHAVLGPGHQAAGHMAMYLYYN